MFNKQASSFFLIFLILIISYASSLHDIPIQSSQDGITIQKDFSSKYRVFSLVGARLNTKLTKYLVSFTKESSKSKSFCLVAPNKGPSSLKRKMDFELSLKHQNNYYYKDFEDVKDFVRSSMIFGSIREIYPAATKSEHKFGDPLKKDNTFDQIKSPYGKGKTGYRDLTYNFALQNAAFSLQRNKTITKNIKFTKPYYLRFEVQLHLCGIFLAKQIGHSIYEITRVLSQINEEIRFEDIIHNELEFEKLFLHIQEILPDKKFEKLVETFEIWKNNKNNFGVIQKFIRKLKKLSLLIYDVSAGADQQNCIKMLQNFIDNEKCSYFRGKSDKLEAISKDFVKSLL